MAYAMYTDQARGGTYADYELCMNSGPAVSGCLFFNRCSPNESLLTHHSLSVVHVGKITIKNDCDLNTHEAAGSLPKLFLISL
jgi:hypothetical protein